MGEQGSATFFPWVRGGIAAHGGETAGGMPRLRVTTQVELSAPAGVEQIPVRFDLLGPGDATGIAATQILRTDPQAGEPAAEPNYLCSIEFDAPELPWVLSPSAGSPAKLQPWIALLVVDAERASLEQRPGELLPFLHYATDDLPPWDEAWAWAHAQILPWETQTVNAITAGDGGGAAAAHTLSRLVSPVRLRPLRTYLACVVPTYAAGVEAARVGGNPAGAGAAPAWPRPDQAIPVYHHWRFRTGERGDFEDLARDLRVIKAEEIPGIGRVDLSLAQGSIRGLDGDLPPIPALRTLLTTKAEFDAMQTESVAAPVAERLATLVSPNDGETDALGRPIVKPPAYGCWPAQAQQIDPGGARWVDALNTSPAHRIAARLGADVVRFQQEELVAEARRQAGAYLAARRARDLLRLGELTSDRLTLRRVTDLPDERRLALTRPSHDVLPFDGATVAERVAGATADPALLSPAMARITARAGRELGVAAPTLRAGVVATTYNAELRLPEVALPAQRADRDRLREVFTRANGLQWQVEGVTVDRLIDLGDAAVRLEQDVAAGLANVALDVQPPPDAGGGGVRDAVIDRPVDPHGVVINRDLVDERVVDADNIDLDRGPLNRALERDGIAADGAIRRLDANEVRLQPLRRSALFDTVVTAGAEWRLAAPVREQVASLLLEAAQPVVQQFEPGQTLQPLAVQRFAVDATTADFGQRFAANAGVATLPKAFNVRAAVRAQLGLVAVEPVRRDELDAATRERFDVAVGGVVDKVVRPGVAFPEVAPPSLPAVAAASTAGIAIGQTFPSAAARMLVVDGIGQLLLPSLIRLDFHPVYSAPLASRFERSLNAWILAGAPNIPENKIVLLGTNPAFIEAVIAGANHELAAELLWRDVPTDPRATVFARFWFPPRRPGDADHDLTPLHLWRGALGKNIDGGGQLLALVLRSPLLRRYPNTIIYAAKGTQVDGNFTPSGEVKPCIFQGNIEPNATFSVIDLTTDEARDKNNGWYVLIAQPPGDARFGLDELEQGSQPTPVQTWRELTWAHVRDADLSPARPPDSPPPGFVWGRTSADLAAILHQDPFRVVLPAWEWIS